MKKQANDLVFYNYILKCFVLNGLKTTKITHQDIGQMDMYDELKRNEGDNLILGILLYIPHRKPHVHGL